MSYQNQYFANGSQGNQYYRVPNQNINPSEYGQYTNYNPYINQDFTNQEARIDSLQRSYATKVRILAFTVLIEDLLYFLYQFFYQQNSIQKSSSIFLYIFIMFVIQLVISTFQIIKIKEGKASHKLYKVTKVLYIVFIILYILWFSFWIVIILTFPLFPLDIKYQIIKPFIISGCLFVGPRIVIIIVVSCCCCRKN